jgi:hypothetical protein
VKQTVQELIDSLQRIEDKTQPAIALVITVHDLFMQASSPTPEQSAKVTKAVDANYKLITRILDEASQAVDDVLAEVRED